jgi:saccharopine dehydrogenase-like NADP-dependent oxidoreductase
MHVLVLGAGAQGKAAIFDLCKNSDITKITVVENDLSQLEKFLKRFDDSRIEIVQADANSRDEMLPLISAADIVIDLLPTVFRRHITELANA